MMDWWVWLVVALALLFLLPISVYLCVKLGTLGYLRAHVQFKQLQQKESTDNGKST